MSSAGTNTCALCLEEMKGAYRNVGAAMPCGHVYHEDCFAGHQASILLGAAQGNTNDTTLCCPTCTQRVNSFGKIFLYLGSTEADMDEYTESASMEATV